MKEKIVQYKLFEAANKLNNIVSSEIKKNVFEKRHNLTGEILNDGEIEIYNAVSLIMFRPNLGPLVKLNVYCTNSNADGSESILKLERVNGSTFLVQYYFPLIITFVTLGIGIYQILANGFEKIEFLLFPIFGISYHFLIRLVRLDLETVLVLLFLLFKLSIQSKGDS